jgi:hypothetical protein
VHDAVDEQGRRAAHLREHSSSSSLRRSAPTRPAAGSGSPVPGPAPRSPSSCGTPSPGISWPLVRRNARDAGALVQLRLALNFVAGTHLLAGEFTTAALMIEEDRLVAEATGNPPITYTEMMLAAWRGEEARASELIEATLREAGAPRAGQVRDPRELRELCALQRPRSPRCRAGGRLASVRARSGGARTLGRPRAGRGGVQDRRGRGGQVRTRVAVRANACDAQRVGAGR